jgi:hypothetical protein
MPGGVLTIDVDPPAHADAVWVRLFDARGGGILAADLGSGDYPAPRGLRRWQPGRADPLWISPPSDPSSQAALLEGDTLAISQSPVAGGPVRLTVPLPSQAGLFHAVVVARRSDGGLSSTPLLVDTRAAPRLWLTGPLDAQLGDRAAWLLRVTNPGPTAIAGTLRISGEADGWAVLDVNGDAAALDAAGLRAGAPLTLPAGRERTITLSVEAIAAGQGRVAFAWDDGQGPIVTERPWKVAANPTAAEPASIRIEREFIALDADAAYEPDPIAPQAESDPLANAQRRLLASGDPVQVGDLILVRERCQAPAGGLRAVVWRQTLPAGARTYRPESSAATPLGRRSEIGLRTLEFQAEATPASFQHEYLMVVTASGAFRFPAPEVRADGQAIVADAGDAALLSRQSGE